jgi:hypothetical protein
MKVAGFPTIGFNATRSAATSRAAAVRIDSDGAGQSAVLPSYSSSFFKLTQPSQIATAFSQIGAPISKLRVAR